LVGSYSTFQGNPIGIFFPNTTNLISLSSLALQLLSFIPPLSRSKKLTWVEMDECQLKVLCYNCDENHFSRHNCKEKKLSWPSLRMFLKTRSRLLMQMRYLIQLLSICHLIHMNFEPFISLNALTNWWYNLLCSLSSQQAPMDFEIITSHQMEKILKKGHFNIISQLNVIQSVETPSVHLDLKSILSKHHTIFSMPHGLPPSRGVHDHFIPLVLGSVPPNVCPYHYPFAKKNEIAKNVQEFLDVGVICHSTIL
jgi:hypothetical protein